MGPNLYSEREGALLEIRATPEARALQRQLDAWTQLVRATHAALEWPPPTVVVRDDGVHAFAYASAPVDVLMTATTVNELAWESVEQQGTGHHAPVDVATMRTLAATERATRPTLAEVHAAAIARGITVTFDDEVLSVGSGTGAFVWRLTSAPSAARVAWQDVHDVPVALVTGSNGKTTTTRLVAAMWRAAGNVAGWCCSDGVWVNDAQLEAGDYSGPAGARAVLRDARVQAAVLETARGGMLRRGLAVHRATAAIITNIAADHFGEYGVHTLHDVAAAKRIVAHALGVDATLVLNADDPELVSLALPPMIRRAWFSVRDSSTVVEAHIAQGGDAAVVRDGRLLLHLARVWHDLVAVADMPLTLGGAAAYNIANIAGASLLAAVMGVPVYAIQVTLQHFGDARADNPGRLQVTRVGGVTIFVDYAHNPDGLAALCRAAASLSATRRLLVLGQAGNRDDSQLRALVRAAWSVTPFDHVIVKELPSMLRGRALGDVPRVLVEELHALGVPDEQIDLATGDADAVQRAVQWARAGDVLVCPVHVEKDAVFEWLGRLAALGWTPGEALPEAWLL